MHHSAVCLRRWNLFPELPVSSSDPPRKPWKQSTGGPVTLEKIDAAIHGCGEPPRGYCLSTDIVSLNGAREVNTPAVCFVLHINFFLLCVHSLETSIFRVVKAFRQRAGNWTEEVICLPSVSIHVDISAMSSSIDMKTHIDTLMFIYN